MKLNKNLQIFRLINKSGCSISEINPFENLSQIMVCYINYPFSLIVLLVKMIPLQKYLPTTSSIICYKC